MARDNEWTLIDNTNVILNRFDSNSQAKLTAAAQEWHKGVVKTLRGKRSGKVYRVPATNRTYRASAPGQAPASRTGDLRTSYRFIVKRSEALIGSPLHYAPKLEKGTRKMAPRPHLRVAYQNNRQAIINALRGDWTE